MTGTRFYIAAWGSAVCANVHFADGNKWAGAAWSVWGLLCVYSMVRADAADSMKKRLRSGAADQHGG